MVKVIYESHGRTMALYGEDKFDAIFSVAPILVCDIYTKEDGTAGMRYNGKVISAFATDVEAKGSSVSVSCKGKYLQEMEDID